MDTIIRKLILCIFCAIPIVGFCATDDDIDAVFMTVTLNDGQSESVMLSNKSEYTGPMFCPTAKTLTINGTCYNTEDVKEIRFDMRQVDAIQDINQPADHFAYGVIYNLNGQIVGRIDASEDAHTSFPPSLKGLPKGVYIVNGRKVIVR